MSRSSSSHAFRFTLSFFAVLTAAACERPTPTDMAGDQSVVDALFTSTSALGGPVSLLTREQRRLFARGREVFTRVFTPETGLGPLFNAEGCAVCHGAPAVGGVGPQVERHATEFTGTACIDHEEVNGGSVVQNLATPLLQAAGIFTEDPIAGTTVGRRQTPDLFGFGLIEAIDDDDIIRRADPDDRDHDGISGRAVLVTSEETGETEVGRFGKKGQVPDLLDFITDATIYEQGITTLDEPDEQLVTGQALPPGVDPAPDPEMTEDDLHAQVAFVQMLAAPPLIRLNLVQAIGRRIFGDIGCASCHTPAFRTGTTHPIAALRGRVFFPYSDFLIHDMGPGLAANCAGSANPSEFRTEPLMGLRFEPAFLHDGSAATIGEAIRRHGGEATRAVEKFGRLSSGQKDALIRFLKTL